MSLALEGQHYSRLNWRFLQSDTHQAQGKIVKLFGRHLRSRTCQESEFGGNRQELSVFHGPHHGGIEMGKSATCDKQEFCAVLRTALAKRLFPVTSLHRKQIADALGTHRDNVDRWFNGESELRGGTLRELVRFFWDRGDRAFLFEILGIEPMSIMPSAAQIAEAVKAKGLAA